MRKFEEGLVCTPIELMQEWVESVAKDYAREVKVGELEKGRKKKWYAFYQRE